MSSFSTVTDAELCKHDSFCYKPNNREASIVFSTQVTEFLSALIPSLRRFCIELLTREICPQRKQTQHQSENEINYIRRTVWRLWIQGTLCLFRMSCLIEHIKTSAAYSSETTNSDHSFATNVIQMSHLFHSTHRAVPLEASVAVLLLRDSAHRAT
jgi:hypothetical protein